MSYTLHPETIKLILEARIAFPEISYRKLGDAFSCLKTTAKRVSFRLKVKQIFIFLKLKQILRAF